ncbi:MAG: hypothetical protein GTO63_30055 [Anaerolineae bacterium]|nr:hypothetical protein [Anaerolineae bacterium]NIN98950.1 hypothetical protein [Anaerolineae bacterium]
MPKSYGFKSKRVAGEGPLNSNIFIFGESPGAEEEANGRPFIGPMGRELDRILAAAGIERRECYIDNICQFRPYGDKQLAFFAGKRPREQYLDGIINAKQLIEQHRPNLVVAVGAYALWGLTLESKITNWRGSIMESKLVPGQKIIPALHPSYLVRGNWHMRQPTIWDFEKAKREAEFPEVDPPQYDITVAQTPAELDRAFEELMRADELSGDLETFGGRDLACFGFSPKPDRAIVIPHTGHQTYEIYKAILESGIPLTFQNAMFEITFMAVVFGILCKNVKFDTMLSSHSLYPTLPKALDFLTSVYTRQAFYKEERKQWKKAGDLSILWGYNAKDCCNTTVIRDAQDPELDEFDARDTFNFEMSLLAPYAEATIKGVRADIALLDKLAAQTTEQIKVVQAMLDESLGQQINVKSPKQVKKVVYEDLGLPRRTRKGKLTTQQDVLMDLAAKTDSPELLMVVRLRRLHKVKSNYATRKILDEDERVRCSWNIAGTKSGRPSSSKTLWDSGTNLANQPKRRGSIFRRVFIPDPGKTFYVYDLAQAESVVVAFESNDLMEIEWFEQGLDSHRMLAAVCLDKDPDDITDSERYKFKRSHHAFNYRMGAIKFMYVVNEDFDETGVGITAEEARQIKELYHIHRPTLQTWWSAIVREARENGGTLQNLAPSNRKRTFIEQWSDDLINDMISWRPQSTVADVEHNAVIQYWQDEEMAELRAAGKVDFLLQQYDGGVWQIDDDLGDDVIQKIAQFHLCELNSNGRRFTIPVEIKKGKTWAEDDLEKIAIVRA